MRKTLYVFNPDTDLALASGDEYYIPPQSIKKMTEDLAVLPLWYGQEGEMHLLKPDDILLVGEFDRVVPWGWNAALIKKLKSLGLPERLLPDGERMNRIRQLSHRSLSVSLLKSLLVSEEYCGSASELFSEQDLVSFVKSNPNTILKAPWSGSGKGLFFCKDKFTDQALLWSRKVLVGQGSVVGEVLYNKEKDFAMEFYSDGKGQVSFAGYSMFRTDNRGAYAGNLLASDEWIEFLLSFYVSSSALYKIKQKLLVLLSEAVGRCYDGYLGVDMMICRFSGSPEYRIHPCVEVNLRMNMGVVAHKLYDNYLVSGKQGYFSMDYFFDSKALLKDHEEKLRLFPLCKEGRRISSGYWALTPVCEGVKYRASLIVD